MAGVTRATFLRRAAAAGVGVLAAPHLLEEAFAAEVAGAHAFVSRPDLRPQVVKAVHHAAGTSDGYLFLAPLSGPGQRGPLIIDETGSPIWFRPSSPVVALNFRAAVYKGQPVLTWWEGKTEHGLGDGTHVIMDDTYNVVARVAAGGGRHSDLHEFIITPRGTALVSAWEARSTSVPNGTVIGGVMQELELPSGRVLFEWRSLDHVGLDESYAGPSTRAPYDYFHINSVELDDDGNYLVSARNTWTIYKIHHGTGEIMWRLGGKKSDFAMGPGTTFAWQHDARRHPGKLISLFDDGAAPPVEKFSRGLVLAVDEGKNKRATLHRAYVHTPKTLAHALGSLQVLPNGNVLVGWGTDPYITEYSARGNVLLDLKMAKGGQNYRALKLPWTGNPATKPAIGVQKNVVYASWNGATEVASWELDTGPAPGSLQQERVVRRTAFETAIPVSSGASYASVTAFDAIGTPLATSRVAKLP